MPLLNETAELDETAGLNETARPLDSKELDDRFDAALAEIEARRSDERARAGLWLSHHPLEEYDRCTVIAGRHVCRRCLLLYSTSLMVAALTLAGVTVFPAAAELWLIWGLCIPATIDFVGEQVGWFRYSARRQMIVTLALGPALGVGFAHELDDRWSWEFWGPVLIFCTIWFFAALIGRHHSATMGEGD